MRIGLQTWGSEGDIRPLVALGHGLARRGHAVELMYTDFEDRQVQSLAESLGFRAIPVGMPVVSEDELTQVGLDVTRTSNPLRQSRIILDKLFTPVSARMFDAATDLCRRSDVVVGHFFVYQLQAAAALTGRPAASLMFAHNLVPSRAITPNRLPRLGTWANGLEWKLAQFAVNKGMRGEINRFRSQVGLPPFRDVMTEAWTSHRLNLIAVSPTICQRPSDWPAYHEVSGFLSLGEHGGDGMPAEVIAFLSDGEPPVFLGFGSLMPRNREKLDETVALLRGAAARASSRAIIQVPVGSHVRPERDGDVLIVGRVSHAAVFPHCGAVVHHGGAGTTQTTLMAGVPSILVPHGADQFFWADELMRLGVAGRPVLRRSLTVEALADRIRRTVSDKTFRQCAAALAPRLRAEDGVETAATLVEGLAT